MNILLIRRAKMQDKDAFCQLIRLYTPNMYKVAKAILRNDEDAADAIQETVLTCWEKINTLQKDNYFKTWLIRILINHCNTIYRQKSRIISDAEMTEPSYTETNYSSVEWQEFLTCLDEKYRILILLYYVEGFKIREIAEILQLNEKTVSGRLASARDKMEKMYTQKTSPLLNSIHQNN
ncbi:MAG: RNA polymerase sigma factor [Eubacteriales bacterium]|nr:RNA polymerase sigma factor [Eubacteriales bacterium]